MSDRARLSLPGLTRQSGALPDLIALAGGPAHVIELADFAGAQRHGVLFSSGAHGHAFHALHSIGDLIRQGRFWLPVERVYSLAEIAEAHRVSEGGHVRGRLVVIVDQTAGRDHHP